MADYPICLEVSGPLAMFARPDTGAAPTSYPLPTWSAAKGILESIAFLGRGEAWLHPIRIEVCRRKGASGGAIRYQRYATNYGGPLRKTLNVNSGTGMQVFATVLARACGGDGSGSISGRSDTPVATPAATASSQASKPTSEELLTGVSGAVAGFTSSDIRGSAAGATAMVNRSF